MSLTFEKLSGENIVVVTYTSPWDPRQDIAEAGRQTANVLAQVEGRLYRIDDLRLSGMTFSTFVQGIDEATNGTPGSMVDERVQGILVGTDELVRMASESMTQDQYGATDTPFFTTLEEALAHARR
ncbi:MAG: hypothetical protein GYB64_15565, partial [Chloroflexi bacterium]|nr:hypothetical protein [Chloroflexota bacterium]